MQLFTSRVRALSLVLLVPIVLGYNLRPTPNQAYSEGAARPSLRQMGAPTPAPRPTHTAVPTATPRPTRTPIPSATPLPQRLAVTTTADTTPCPNGAGNPGYSLRCAIVEVDGTQGGHTITFAIPSSDPGCQPMEIHGTTVTVCSIGPTRALPPLTASSTTIDGYSQTGASPNTSPTGADNAVITVRLDGAGFNGNGLYLSGTSGDTVQGLSVVNFHQGVAIGAANSDGTSLVGNFIGVGPNGSLQGNQSAIAFSNDRNSGIGGVTASARNIISDSAFSGIRIANSNGIRIAGNFIGTDTNDRTRAGNANGISLITVINSVIGGYDDGLRNVVSGNAGSGIAIANGTADKIVGNYIGTNRSGSATLGNGAYGIDLSQHASAVVIDRNVISHNGKAGVVLGEIGPGKAISAQIERNSMFGNKGLGIDEVPEGISNCSILLKNHFDTPPCPIIRKATATQVRGSACRGCTVEIYIATREHQNRGFGEGKKYLARVSASNGTWSLTLHAGQFDPRRQQLTATTTTTSRSSRKTSEFALNMPVKFRILNLRARFVIRHAPGIKKRPGPSIKVGIRVDWKVAAQTGIAGFNLYAGNYRLNSALIPAGRSHVHSFGAFFPTPGKVPGPSSLVVVLENGVTDKVPIRPA